jgi:hypothetical protein
MGKFLFISCSLLLILFHESCNASSILKSRRNQNVANYLDTDRIEKVEFQRAVVGIPEERFVSGSEVIDFIDELKNKGFYKTSPFHLKRQYSINNDPDLMLRAQTNSEYVEKPFPFKDQQNFKSFNNDPDLILRAQTNSEYVEKPFPFKDQQNFKSFNNDPDLILRAQTNSEYVEKPFPFKDQQNFKSFNEPDRGLNLQKTMSRQNTKPFPFKNRQIINNYQDQVSPGYVEKPFPFKDNENAANLINEERYFNDLDPFLQARSFESQTRNTESSNMKRNAPLNRDHLSFLENQLLLPYNGLRD